MKAARMHGIDVAELQRQAQEAQEQLFRFRFQMGMGQMEGLKKYRNSKRDRARMLTVLAEKQAAGENVPPAPIVKTVAPKSDKKRKK